jgi:hypothetical protein
MNMWRVGEDMGSKEMDGCPLTGVANNTPCAKITAATLIQGARAYTRSHRHYCRCPLTGVGVRKSTTIGESTSGKLSGRRA